MKETIYFINVYAKNEQEDLTPDECKAFRAVIKCWKESSYEQILRLFCNMVNALGYEIEIVKKGSVQNTK